MRQAGNGKDPKMTKTTETARPTNMQALDAFVRDTAELRGLLAELQVMTEDHFNVSPDDASWGDVGNVVEIVRRVKLAIAFAKDQEA